jgi:uncharacterized membrane protein YhiD involved in acid resistance
MMPLSPSWYDSALRLALTIAACGVTGFNRGVRGHAVGLRTTILVGLAIATLSEFEKFKRASVKAGLTY